MRRKMYVFSICFTLLVGGVYAQSKMKGGYPNVNDAYGSWKKNHVELRNNEGLSNQHQAIAVSARRLDEKTATVQVMVVSDFDNDGKGFDIKVSAQPMQIQKTASGNILLEKSGGESEIEASGLSPQKINGQDSVLAKPSLTLPAQAGEDAVRITINLFDGEKTVTQTISVPLRYEGAAVAIGRFAPSYSRLTSLWCGSCENCGRVCENCPSGQSGNFNCAACTVTCQ